MNLLITENIENNDFIFGLCDILEKNGGVLLIDADKITGKYLYEPLFIFIKSKSDNIIKAKTAVIISEPENDNVSGKLLLYKDKNETDHIVSVGTGNKDDIALSSNLTSEICISIQSVITNIQGNDILPFELNAKMKKNCNLDTILTAAAILIITGKISSETDYFVL